MFSKEYPLKVQICFLDWLVREGFSTFLSERFSFSQIFCPLRVGEADAEDEDRKDCYLGVRLPGRGIPWLGPPPCFQAFGMELKERKHDVGNWLGK